MNQVARQPNGPRPLTERERVTQEMFRSGLTPRQIAQKLGITMNSVRNALMRARDKAPCSLG